MPVSPGLILAIGHMIAESALTGLEIKAALDAARATGKIPESEWKVLFTEWDNARRQLDLPNI